MYHCIQSNYNFQKDLFLVRCTTIVVYYDRKKVKSIRARGDGCGLEA